MSLRCYFFNRFKYVILQLETYVSLTYTLDVPTAPPGSLEQVLRQLISPEFQRTRPCRGLSRVDYTFGNSV